MNKSFFSQQITRAMLDKQRDEFETALPSIRKLDADAWAKIGEHEELEQDHLALLIDDTAKLISENGYVVPLTVTAAVSDVTKQTIDWALAHVSPEFLEIVKSGKWRDSPQDIPREFSEIVAKMAWAQNDPQTLLYSAYASFMCALQARDSGNLQESLNQASLGASFLVRATFAIQSAHRRSGGHSKQQKNPTAILKSRAIVESRSLWEERERGLHPKLRTEDQFAIEVARRWPQIASISAIKKRSSNWRKSSRNKK